MTVIEFFIGGILLIFGVVTGTLIIFMGVVLVGTSISILGFLIKVRIFWEIPLSPLLVCVLWIADTQHITEPQTLLLTIAVLTAIIVVDIIMYFINILERKTLDA